MSRGHIFAVAAAAYLAIAVLTFGHSAANTQRAYDACHQQRLATGNYEYCGVGGGPGAAVAAMFWPFYWSWEAWS